MTRTETVPAKSTVSNRARLPRVVSLFVGVTILTAAVLCWVRSGDEDPSGPTALGSTLSVGTLEESAVRKTTTGSKSTEQAATKLPEPTPVAPTRSEDAPIPSEPTANSHNESILGTWKQYSHGHRLLKVLEGGKATLDVKLDGLSALAFGEKMQFEIEWTIEGDTLKFKTTGGTPQASVDAVNSVYGDHRVYRILEINEKQMLLQEGDEKKTPWDRVLNDDEAKP